MKTFNKLLIMDYDTNKNIKAKLKTDFLKTSVYWSVCKFKMDVIKGKVKIECILLYEGYRRLKFRIFEKKMDPQ